MRGKPGYRTLLRLTLFVAGFAVLAVLAWNARDGLAQLPGRFAAGWFALALAGGLLFTLVQALVYARLMHKYGIAAAQRSLAGIFLWSQPGKYLPGKIWAPAMQAAELGSSAIGATFLSNAELMLLALGQSAGLGIALSLTRQPALALAVLAATLAASALLLRQRWTAQLLHWAGGRLRWLPAVLIPPVGTPFPAAAALALSALVLLLNLAASIAVVQSYAGLSPEHVLPLLGAIYLGSAAGSLALPVPAGIGVREASAVAFAHWLVADVPASTVIAVTLIARVWQLGVDLLAVLLAVALKLQARQR